MIKEYFILDSKNTESLFDNKTNEIKTKLILKDKIGNNYEVNISEKQYKIIRKKFNLCNGERILYNKGILRK